MHKIQYMRDDMCLCVHVLASFIALITYTLMHKSLQRTHPAHALSMTAVFMLPSRALISLPYQPSTAAICPLALAAISTLSAALGCP